MYGLPVVSQPVAFGFEAPESGRWPPAPQSERTSVYRNRRPITDRRLSICGRPFERKRYLQGLASSRMLPSVRPVMQLSCWPVWEFADRNHITNSVLMARWKALVLPAPSRRLLCHTLLRPTAPSDASGPPRLMPRLRPELCNPLASPAMPTRCAPSCWQGRP